MPVMQIFVAAYGGTKHAVHQTVIENGWGLCYSSSKQKWREDVPLWFFDNGAYSAWKQHGFRPLNWRDFPEAEMLRRIDTLESQECTIPAFGVLPDLPVSGMASFGYSLHWRPRLPDHWSWYLAIQDGFDPSVVEANLKTQWAGTIDGLFLGGSTPFKRQAGFWCSMAHKYGLKFHYARCGTIKRLEHALAIGADSVDSSSLTQNARRDAHLLAEYVRLWKGKPRQQLLESV